MYLLTQQFPVWVLAIMSTYYTEATIQGTTIWQPPSPAIHAPIVTKCRPIATIDVAFCVNAEATSKLLIHRAEQKVAKEKFKQEMACHYKTKSVLDNVISRLDCKI